MMKKIVLISTLLGVYGLAAQQFRPYHALGLQMGVNVSSLWTEQSAAGEANGEKAGDELSAFNPGFDLLAHYDYGLFKWLGVGSGLGLSARGGNVRSGTGVRNPDKKRDIYYLNIPIRIQLKPAKWFWIEPGIENKIYL